MVSKTKMPDVNIQTLCAAEAEAESADARALKAMKRCMYRGRHVAWMHGKHRQEGFVERVLGHRFFDAVVAVRNARTGNVVRVSLWAMRQAGYFDV